MIDATKPENQILIELYKANKKLCMIIMMGSGESHGIVLLSQKKWWLSKWKTSEFIEKAKKANTSFAASTIIKLVKELDWLQPKDARDFL